MKLFTIALLGFFCLSARAELVTQDERTLDDMTTYTSTISVTLKQDLEFKTGDRLKNSFQFKDGAVEAVKFDFYAEGCQMVVRTAGKEGLIIEKGTELTFLYTGLVGKIWGLFGSNAYYFGASIESADLPKSVYKTITLRCSLDSVDRMNAETLQQIFGTTADLSIKF